MVYSPTAKYRIYGELYKQLYGKYLKEWLFFFSIMTIIILHFKYLFMYSSNNIKIESQGMIWRNILPISYSYEHGIQQYF